MPKKKAKKSKKKVSLFRRIKRLKWFVLVLFAFWSLGYFNIKGATVFQHINKTLGISFLQSAHDTVFSNVGLARNSLIHDSNNITQNWTKHTAIDQIDKIIDAVSPDESNDEPYREPPVPLDDEPPVLKKVQKTKPQKSADPHDDQQNRKKVDRPVKIIENPQAPLGDTSEEDQQALDDIIDMHAK